MHERYLVEVLGGVLIVLSSAVGEQMHGRLKRFSYILFGILAVVYVVMAIGLDRAADAREAKAQSDAEESRSELLNTQRSLIEAEQQLTAKSDEIASLNKEIAASVTGGHEFAYLEPLLADDQQQHRLFLIVVHQGKYPIYDVGLRVLDLRLGGTKPLAEEMLSNTFTVGNLAPNQRHFVAYWPLAMPVKSHYGFNFFFTARNAAGFVAQQARFVKVGEKWLYATEVTPFNSTQILYSHVDPGFPRNAHGKVDWNDEGYSSGN